MAALVPAAWAAKPPAPAPRPAADPQPWWNADWPWRVRVRLNRHPGASATGSVHLYGHAARDGHDLRLVDATGRPVNFRVLDHDPAYLTTIQMQVPDGAEFTAWLYFGNPSAPAIDTASANPDSPGWQGRDGVLVRTWRKVRPGHPKTLEELRAMIQAAGRPEGVSQEPEMSLGSNPFGESDQYVTAMEGYLRVPREAEYGFRAFADDGCWVLVDGKEVLSWPGPREAAADGETWRQVPRRDFTLTLSAGLHRIEFYHEEGEGLQIATLAWKPPWAWTVGGKPYLVDGKEYFGFRSIAPSEWGWQRIVRFEEFQAHGRPLVAAPAAWVEHTFWVPDTEQPSVAGRLARQLAFVSLQDLGRSAAGRIVKTEWTTDDGVVRRQEGEPRRLHHIFFSNGLRRATVTVTDEAGNTATESCPLRLWQINVARTARGRFDKDLGQQSLYLDLLQKSPPYPIEKMTHDDLAGYAVFWYVFDKDHETSKALARLYREKPDHPRMPQLAVIGAEAATRGGFDADLALAMLDLASQNAPDEKTRLDYTFRRAYVLAWGKADYPAALAIYDRLFDEHGKSESAADRAVARRALIARGDVLLLQAEYDEADAAYRKAEDLDPRPMTRAEKMTKIGGYPYAVEDYLARDLHKLALETIDRWEDLMPRAKLEGLTFFLRGKVMVLARPSVAAARCLDLAARVSPQALHVPEAVWLRANCLMDLGRYEEALAGFVRVRDEFTTSDYYKRAADKVRECKAKLDAVRKGD
jgi:tetratricopeptide (TPR) repeat protein